MNYLPKNKLLNNRSPRPTTIAVIIIVVIGIIYLFAWNVLNTAIFAVGRPIWSVKNYLAEQIFMIRSSFMNSERLALENEKLREELEEAEIALKSLAAYEEENRALKNDLGRFDGEERIIAAILTKPNLSPYDTFVIDAGSTQNVKTGDYVLSGNFLIGMIGETHPNYSKAILYSTNDQTTTVTIGANNIQTEAVGRGGGNFTAKLPKEIGIKTGDLVKLSGLNQKFFGTVGDIEKTLTGSFQTILFSLPVNIHELKWVEIAAKQEI